MKPPRFSLQKNPKFEGKKKKPHKSQACFRAPLWVENTQLEPRPLCSPFSIPLCPPTSTKMNPESTQNSRLVWAAAGCPVAPAAVFVLVSGQAEPGPRTLRWDSRRAARTPAASRHALGEDEVRDVVLGKATGNGENSRKCSNPVFLGESSSAASPDGRGTDVTEATGKLEELGWIHTAGMWLCSRRAGDARPLAAGTTRARALPKLPAACSRRS